MYSNVIYLITVILIHTFHRSVGEGFFPPAVDLGMLAASLAAYGFLSRAAFSRLEKKTPRDMFLGPRHRRALSVLSIFAVVLFGLQSFFFDLDKYLRFLPGAVLFPTVQALWALMFFLLHLSVLWFFAYRVHGMIRPTSLTRTGYIWANLRFYLALILPWALVSLPHDLGQVFLRGGAREAFLSLLGQGVFLALALALLLMVGPRMVVWGWGCRPLRGPSRRMITNVLDRLPLRFKEVLGWPLMGGDAPNAAVLGFFRGFRYLLVTPSLLELLSPGELEAVVAHEAGHVKKKHLLIHLVLIAGLFPLIFLMEGLAERAILESDSLYRLLVLGGGARQMVSLASLAGLALVAVVYLRYVMGYFIRNMEREADLYALRAVGDPMPLITSLEKLAAATGGLKQEKSWHHYGPGERIGFLMNAGADPEVGRSHERRLKRFLVVFIAAACLVLAAGVALRPSGRGPGMEAKRLRLLTAMHPEDPQVQRLAGDWHYSKENWAEARARWEEALELAPDDPETMNNLAWLLATCPDKEVRDPARALKLARQAVKLSPGSPHILDTLAEAYFRMGFTREAIDTEKKALSRAGENREHYIKQLERFRAAQSEDRVSI